MCFLFASLMYIPDRQIEHLIIILLPPILIVSHLDIFRISPIDRALRHTSLFSRERYGIEDLER